MEIVALKEEHWPQVKKIYQEGIDTGQATFEIKSPNWDKWDSDHIDLCRFIALDDGRVIGWAALLPVSARTVYKGVAEESIYISPESIGRGLGYKLLTHLIRESEMVGIYSLQAVMFPENTASVRLHEKCGFRKIGIKQKIAKQNGKWRDTVLYERRSTRFS